MPRYVPVIRWKRGERVGLSNVANATKARFTPLIVIAPEQFVGKKATKSTPIAVPPATTLAQGIVNDWGTYPFFLDASAVPDVPQGHHPLVDIASACRALGAALIPVTHATATAQYQQAIATVVHADARGAGLRVDLQGMASAQQWIANWTIPLNATDLLVDFRDNVATVAALGTSLDHAFQNLYGAGHWRSVTSIGTSIPDNFSGYLAGLHTVRRIEWHLWQHLSGIGLPYTLDFGDYATVAIAPPPSGIAWGYPINVKYTLNGDFLVCRGVGTTGLGGVDMDQQLITHAQSIRGYAQRNPIACWGDARADAIAAQAEPPSGLEHWVRISLNRHIELTRLNLP
jgi:hypothetical protein